MRAWLLISASGLASALAAAPTSAQTMEPAGTADAPAGQAAAPPADPGLTDIIVTAQRRSESLQRAAIPVSAVSGDALVAAGVTRPTELTALVPSLQVAPSAGPYNLFYLRGVGNFQGNALSESAIAFTFNGVYVGRPSGTTGFFYDLERVEVVKGPQGTLYGRNATGGAINVIAARPVLDALSVQGSAEYGNYDALRLDGVVNVPLGDRAALRLAAIKVRHDGYMNDGSDDQDDWGARASFRLDATSQLRFDIVADYFDQGGRGVGSTLLLAPRGVPTAATSDVDDRIGFLSPQGQALYTSQRANTLQRNFQPVPSDLQPFQRNSAWGVAGTATWDSAAGTLTVIPAFRRTSLDYRSFSPGFQIREQSRTDQGSLEVRFATRETRPLRALIGGYLFNEGTFGPAQSYVSNWNGQYDRNLRSDTNSRALFGRLTWAIVPDFRITAGARQTWEDKRFSGQRLSYTRICAASPAACVNAPSLPYGTTPPPQTATQPIGFNPLVIQAFAPVNSAFADRFDKFTWRVGADWDLSPRNLLYASYETGFKAGGFFFSPGAGTYRPETIKAYTVGSKNRFLDNRVQLNVELFHWRYDDQQITHLVNIANTPTFATENIGRATFKGAEVETRVAVTRTTTVGADAQYLDARYDRFVYAQSNAAGIANPALFNGTGCPTTGFDAASGNAFLIDCSGRRPANAPEWSVNLSAQQRIPASFGEFALDARAHYQSRTLTGLEFLPIEDQPGYWLVNASVKFTAPNDRFTIAAFANNLFDETVKSQMFPTPGTDLYSATLRPPRTYGVRAAVRF